MSDKQPTTHGYSGKPLYQKLGLKPGMRCTMIHPPDHVFDLLQGVEGVEFSEHGRDADMVHFFCADRSMFDAGIDGALAMAAQGGMVWVSWPKKSSALFVDLTEDMLRESMQPTGWVDVKVCAVDQDWSGLKFLCRRS